MPTEHRISTELARWMTIVHYETIHAACCHRTCSVEHMIGGGSARLELFDRASSVGTRTSEPRI